MGDAVGTSGVGEGTCVGVSVMSSWTGPGDAGTGVAGGSVVGVMGEGVGCEMGGGVGARIAGPTKGCATGCMAGVGSLKSVLSLDRTLSCTLSMGPCALFLCTSLVASSKWSFCCSFPHSSSSFLTHAFPLFASKCIVFGLFCCGNETDFSKDNCHSLQKSKGNSSDAQCQSP